MARMPWLQCVAGVSLMAALAGCQSPQSTTGIQPPPLWPADNSRPNPTPGSGTPGSASNQLGSSGLSPRSNSPQIGQVSGQGAPMNPKPATLQRFDPSAPPPQPSFNDFSTGGQPISPPQPQLRPMGEMSPPPPTNALRPQLPISSPPPFAPPAPLSPQTFDNPQFPGSAQMAPSIAPNRGQPSVYQPGN